MVDSEKPDVRFTAVFEAVDMQLEDNRPPITRVTFERLKSEGVSEVDAKLMIGAAFADEIRKIVKGANRMDLRRYTENLKRLPAISWKKVHDRRLEADGDKMAQAGCRDTTGVK